MDIWYSTGRAGSNGHPVLRFLKSPSLAIFLCVIDHFISEMTDCAQQQKTVPLSVPPARQPPFQPPKPRLASLHYGVYKNSLPARADSRGSQISWPVWRSGKPELLETEFAGCCFSSAISFMKWSITQGKIAMEGDFRGQRTGCPLPPARQHIIAMFHFINEI